MKIDSGMLSSYVIGRQQKAPSEDGGHGDANHGALPRSFTPTVAPSMPTISSSFANALWLAGVKQDDSAAASNALVAEFIDLSRMTPAERLRREMLEELGLTEDSLKGLPEEQRAAIEEDIRRAIQEQLGIEETTAAAGLRGEIPAGDVQT
jgi:hypothetical protein